MTLVAGEYMYQSDGVYSPTTGNTVWNVPYLSNLKVGSLSAISANTGSLTNTGTFTSGSSPALSGNSMVGTGGVIYANGNFAFGNDQTNIVFNGVSAFINGFTAITSTSYGANTVQYQSTAIWGTIGTFTITKPSLAIISIVGGAAVTLTGYSSAVCMQIDCRLAIFDSANNMVWEGSGSDLVGLYFTFSSTSRTAGVGFYTVPIFQVTSGTYTLKAYAPTQSNFVCDANGLITVPTSARPMSSNVSLTIYQAQV
jgi:hypothetical protein